MKLNDKKIAIIGGGPAGLTLARLLQMQHVHVNVYERDFDRNARVQGSPLDMHEHSGLLAIREMHLLDPFKNAFRRGADRKIITDQNANIFLSDHDGKPEENFGHAYFRPEIDRGPLRNMLLEALQPETVVWNSHFVSMECERDGWRLHFKNGTNAYADVVIACDGANSKVRPYVTSVRPVYTGIVMLDINIADAKRNAPKMFSMLNGGKVMAFGNEQCILGGQKENGEIGFYLSFKAEEAWMTCSKTDFSDRNQFRDWFVATYSNWSEIWHEIVDAAELPPVPRPIYCAPLDQDWTALPNLTLIGDAAHVMPPFAGEGANMAMLDALELSKKLTSDDFETIGQAIAAHEIEMRYRAAAAAKESLENGELMHSENALQAVLKLFAQH